MLQKLLLTVQHMCSKMHVMTKTSAADSAAKPTASRKKSKKQKKRQKQQQAQMAAAAAGSDSESKDEAERQPAATSAALSGNESDSEAGEQEEDSEDAMLERMMRAANMEAPAESSGSQHVGLASRLSCNCATVCLDIVALFQSCDKQRIRGGARASQDRAVNS